MTPPADSSSNRPSRQLRQAIQSRSRKVNLGELAQSKKTGRVVSMATLEQILLEAVENVLLDGPADPLLDREGLQDRTRQEFRKLLDTHQQALHAKSKAERERESLAKQVEALRRELATQTERLEKERQRPPLAVTLSAESLQQMERRVRGLLQDLTAPGQDGKLAAARAPSELESRLVEVFDSVLGQERERLAAEHARARAGEVDHLERRIGKLSAALHQAEKDLSRSQQETAEAQEQARAVPATATPPASRPAPAPGGRQAEVIKAVFVNNLRLRGRTVRDDDLDGVSPELLLDVEPAPDPTTKA